MTRWAVATLFAGLLMPSSGLSPAAGASAPEAPRHETGTSLKTRTVSRITAVTMEAGRTISVDVHRHWEYFDWLEYEILDRGDSVVVSIVEEGNPDSRWEIVAIPPLVPGPHDDVLTVRVEAIHADSVVLLQCDQTYGIYCTSIKVFFDAVAKNALGRVEFEPLGESTLLQVNNAIISVVERRSFDRNRADSIVVRYSPGEPVLISGPEREAIIATLPKPPAQCHTLDQIPILEGGLLDPSVTPLTRSSCFVQVASSPPLWTFNFPLKTFDARGRYEKLPGIAVQDGDSFLAYPLTQSTAEDLGIYRREFVPRTRAEGIGRFKIQEWIDAFGLHANRLWFGKGFYDGEGYTGVGSLSYFDIDRRSYKTIRLPEIADWSTSSILVEDRWVWMGLVGYGEGADHSGGLLRYDRSTGETRIYPIEDVITHILGHNSVVYVGAKKGRLYVLEKGSITSRYAVEPTLSAGLEIHSLPIEQ